MQTYGNRLTGKKLKRRRRRRRRRKATIGESSSSEHKTVLSRNWIYLTLMGH
jgi:hypothetical protein